MAANNYKLQISQKQHEKEVIMVFKNEHEYYCLEPNLKTPNGSSIKEKVDLIILPEDGELKKLKRENLVLICTNNYKRYLIRLYPELENCILEANEKINTDGEIVNELTEPDINNILRTVFNIKPKQVFITLTNSQYNNLHQNTLRNLLTTAGIKVYSK